MSDKKHHIDQLFKQYLVGYHTTPPEGAWDRLYQDLHGKARIRPLWYRYAIAAAILLLIGIAGLWFFLFRSPVNEFAASSDKPFIPDTITTQIHSEKSVEGLSQADNLQSSDTPAATIPSPNLVSKPSSGESQLAVLTNLPDTSMILTDLSGETMHGEETPITELQNETDHSKSTPEEQAELFNNNQEAAAPARKDDIADITIQPLNVSKKPDFQKPVATGWSLGSRIAPVYSFRRLSTVNQPEEAAFYNEMESGLLSLSAGIRLNYRFSERWSINSGMMFTRIGQVNDQVYAIAQPDKDGLYKLNTSAGAVYINPRKFEAVMIQQHVSTKDSVPGGYRVDGAFVQNLDYFEVPLVMLYKLTDQRISLSLAGGLSPGILVNNRSYFEKDGKKLQTGIIEGVSPAILNTHLGFGIDYAISPKVFFNLEPSLRYSINSITDKGSFKTHPYSVSLFTGITYRFD